MRTYHKLLLFALLAAVLFLAGCRECKVNSDCSSRPCYDVSCEEKKCVSTTMPDCCGNNECDGDENSCTCTIDCGRCEGKQGKYLEKLCQNDECVSGISSDKIIPESLTHSKDLRGIKINVLVNLDQPFDMSTSTLFFEAEMIDKKDNVIEARINKVQIVSKDRRKEIVLGEKQINRVFWGIGSKISEEINLNQGLQGQEHEVPVLIRIFYEYTEKIDGEKRVKRSSYDKTLASKMVFVKPTTEHECSPSKDCNDNNDCTIDSCIEGTLLCNHDYIPECCGNYQCELGENRANCAMDCGPCLGSAGTYLEYRQKGSDCLLVFKSGVLKSTTLSKTKTLTDFKITSKITFNQPLDVTQDKFEVEIILDDFDPERVQLPITITRIQFLDGTTLIAEQEEDLRLLGLGRKAEASIPVTLTIEGLEEEKNLLMKLHYSYNLIKGDTVELKTGIVDENLGRDFVFVNTK